MSTVQIHPSDDASTVPGMGNTLTVPHSKQKYGSQLSFRSKSAASGLSRSFVSVRSGYDDSNEDDDDEEESEEEEEEEQPVSVKDTFLTFCGETSAHGIANIVKDDSWSLMRFIWMLIVCIGLSGIGLHLYVVVSQYLQYGSTESVRVRAETPEFPSVTLCNAEAFSLIDQMEHKETFTSGQVEIFNTFIRSLQPVAEQGNSDASSYLASIPSDIVRENLQELVDLEEFVLHFRNRINSKSWIFENFNLTAENFGHERENFVYKCTVNGKPCIEEDFILFRSPYFFNCYTYEVGWSVIGVGPNSGISFELFLDDWKPSFIHASLHDLSSNVKESIGAFIEIHEKGTLPNPLVSGISISPGHSTQLSVRQKINTKVGGLYSNCTDEEKLPELTEYDYSMKSCYDVCKLAYVYEMCGCVISDIPVPRVYLRRGAQYCGRYLGDALDMALRVWCEYKALQTFETGLCGTNNLPSCNEPCHYHTFEVANSNNIWPGHATLIYQNESPELFRDLIHMYAGRDEDFDVDTLDYKSKIDLVRSNFARVNVYFEELTVLEQEASQAMTLGDLFANVGGTIGLWMGISTITLCEFILFVVQMSHVYFKNRRARNEQAQGERQ